MEHKNKAFEQHGGSSVNAQLELDHFKGQNQEEQNPGYKKVYFGNELDNKSPQELEQLGIENIEKKEGKGWYNLKLITRDSTQPTPDNMMDDIQRLILENGELASHLEKCSSLMTIHKDMQTDRVKDHVLETQILDAKIKKANQKISELQMLIDQRMEEGLGEDFDMANVEYDDTDSKFSVSDIGDRIEGNDITNIFELVINSAQFEISQVQEAFTKAGVPYVNLASDLKILFLIDFFNFETQHSMIYTGYSFVSDFQAVYTIDMDRDFLKFSKKDGFKIEVVACSGENRCKIGECRVSLMDLIQRNAKNLSISRTLSAIVKTTREVTNNMIGFPVGSLDLSYRFRRPCGVICKLFLEEAADFNVVKDTKGYRKLVVKIKEANGLPPNSKTFITYALFDQGEGNFFTNSILGRDPRFEYVKSHEILFTPELNHIFKNQSLDFMAFDDSLPVQRNDSDDEETDLLGTCSIKLEPLLRGEMIDDTFLFKTPNQVGNFYVRICLYFYDFKGEGYFDELYAQQNTLKEEYKEYDSDDEPKDKKHVPETQVRESNPYSQSDAEDVLYKLGGIIKKLKMDPREFVEQKIDKSKPI